MKNPRREELSLEEPSPELKEAMTNYVLASAKFRQEKDRLVATWRDMIHHSMMEVQLNFKLLHDVMSSMDEYLQRSKHGPLND